MSYTEIEVTPVSKARKVGLSLAGTLGEEAFVELELAYATRLLPRFSDDPVIRVNQNVLLYWHFGYYKSTIIKVFRETIPSSLRVVDISSMTPEKIFGSIDEKRKHIIEPAFTNEVNFVIVSELTSLLGQHDFMRQFVNLMNLVLENERVSRQTLKLGQGEINEAELIELSSKGVSYDARIGELSYTGNICVFAATRPLDNRYFTYLSKSGHFSRYHVVQYCISDEEASIHLHKEFRLDEEELAQLKETNLALSKIKVKKVLRPSEELMKPIYGRLEELLKDEIHGRTDLTLASIINPKLKGDTIRELVAHAFLRTAAQNGYKHIEELQYTREDVDFILDRIYHFIEFTLNPIIAENYSKIPKNGKKAKVKIAVLEYLNDGAERHINEIAKALEPLNVCQATIYNALKELEKEGRITRLKLGSYKLVKKTTQGDRDGK